MFPFSLKESEIPHFIANLTNRQIFNDSMSICKLQMNLLSNLHYTFRMDHFKIVNGVS